MKDYFGIIYLLINKVNNKTYIGQTVNVRNRMNAHKTSEADDYLHNAIRKYGWNNFELLFLDICRTDGNDLTELEQFYIDKFDSMNRDRGYNLKQAGSSGKFSEDSRKRMSLSRTGNKNHMYGRKGRANPNFNKKTTDETKEKIRKALIGEKCYIFGKKRNKESIRKTALTKMKSIKCNETGISFESISACARAMKLNRGNISNHLNKNPCHKHVGNFTFSFISIENSKQNKIS